MFDFLFALIELFSLSIIRFRSYEAKCVQLGGFHRGQPLFKTTKNRFLSHRLGHLGVTYALHLWLVVKPVIIIIIFYNDKLSNATHNSNENQVQI